MMSSSCCGYFDESHTYASRSAEYGLCDFERTSCEWREYTDTEPDTEHRQRTRQQKSPGHSRNPYRPPRYSTVRDYPSRQDLPPVPPSRTRQTHNPPEHT
uniref:Uncharacterized protein n=1 Tax=Knipowitschia caucasica TaxID=637954 RepID=A0AAV2LGS9_KNICA